MNGPMVDLIELLEVRLVANGYISLDGEESRQLIQWMKTVRLALEQQTVFIKRFKAMQVARSDGEPER